MRYTFCPLEDPRLYNKFCESMDRHYHCRADYGTSERPRGECVACPWSTAYQVMWLMHFKGMSMGEAIKATLRSPISKPEGREIVREAVAGQSQGQSQPRPDAAVDPSRAAVAEVPGLPWDPEDD